MTRTYLYSVEERLWHWVQALVILALMGTGAVIHWPGALAFVPFDLAIRMHEWLGILLTVNAVVGLLYHLFSHELSQFLPKGRTWTTLAFAQARYYAWGMFRGEAHPMHKTAARKLNPLQQVTYLGILNLLLPLQVVTGAAMLAGRWDPSLTARLGDLGLLAPLHMLGAWLFAAFLVAHVYLTTTGHTPLSNMVAMITGWEDTDEEGA